MQEKQCTGTIFYNGEALTAFRNASKFKGKNGRIATLPDVVDAKLSADDDTPIWHKYFATSTGEHFGSSRGGNKILIVGHNVGPFANQERVLNGEFKQGFLELGRTEFRRLESGIYGPVEVFDMKEVCDEDSYDSLHSDAAKQRKLLRARLGPRTDEFLDRHERLSTSDLARTGERMQCNCVIQNEHDFSYRFFGIKRGQVVYDKNRSMMYKRTCSSHANLLRHGYWGYLVTIEQPRVVHHSHSDFSAT